MTNVDLALIVIAAAATTAAVLIPCWHLHVRSYRRALTHVRARLHAYRAEAVELRADRLAQARTWLADTDQAVRVTEPVPYQLADPTAYLPVFTGDSPTVAEYASFADAIRPIRPFRRGAAA